jgi:putative oxidoreductase
MKIVALICRILVGLGFIVFGANALHPFMPMGPLPPADSLVGKFIAVMMDSGWTKFVGGFQLVGGLLVLSGGALPLGLCILCPITVNILLFHALVAGGQGIAAGLFFTVLELVLIYAYRSSFAGILSVREKVTV